MNIFLDATSAPTTDSTTGKTDYSNWWGDVWKQIQNFFSVENIATISIRIVSAIVTLVLSFLLVKLMNFLIAKFLGRRRKNCETGKKEKIKVNYSVLYFTQSFAKAVIYTLAVIFVLMVFGADFTGLGTIIAGAVAGLTLSLQDVISSLTYGIIIISANEFQVDDYITIQGGPDGIVKRISLLYTVLNSLNGERIYIPNNVVGKSATINDSAEKMRNLRLTFNVPNSTNLKIVREIALKVANSDDKVMKNPAPFLVVTGFTDDSVTLSLRMYCLNEDYWALSYRMNEQIYTKIIESGNKIGRGTIEIKVADKAELSAMQQEQLKEEMKSKKNKK